VLQLGPTSPRITFCANLSADALPQGGEIVPLHIAAVRKYVQPLQTCTLCVMAITMD
jgi:hypothetical protein